jgi:NAD-dependent dihydropyrimidine dehydrogenase PreA subunit
MAETGPLAGVFIDVEVDDSVANDPELAAKLAEVCPVDIFAVEGDDGRLAIVKENLDECVLCELCLDATPDGSVVVKKLYDGTELRR